MFKTICILSFCILKILKMLAKILNCNTLISVGFCPLLCMLAIYVWAVSSCVWVRNSVRILRGPHSCCYTVSLGVLIWFWSVLLLEGLQLSSRVPPTLSDRPLWQVHQTHLLFLHGDPCCQRGWLPEPQHGLLTLTGPTASRQEWGRSGEVCRFHLYVENLIRYHVPLHHTPIWVPHTHNGHKRNPWVISRVNLCAVLQGYGKK
jgi:hypothetical protein